MNIFTEISLGMPKKKLEIIEINRIRVVLAEKNMSQKELAGLVGNTPQSITRICSNKSQPTLRMLWKMAIALDVDVRDLLNSNKKKV
jgi:transcriptional regulator with XRE-family HTH domain